MIITEYTIIYLNTYNNFNVFMKLLIFYIFSRDIDKMQGLKILCEGKELVEFIELFYYSMNMKIFRILLENNCFGLLAYQDYPIISFLHLLEFHHKINHYLKICKHQLKSKREIYSNIKEIIQKIDLEQDDHFY